MKSITTFRFKFHYENDTKKFNQDINYYIDENFTTNALRVFLLGSEAQDKYL